MPAKDGTLYKDAGLITHREDMFFKLNFVTDSLHSLTLEKERIYVCENITTHGILTFHTWYSNISICEMSDRVIVIKKSQSYDFINLQGRDAY